MAGFVHTQLSFCEQTRWCCVDNARLPARRALGAGEFGKRPKGGGAAASRVQGHYELDTRMTTQSREPFELGPMPLGRPMEIVDERIVHAPWRKIFDIARQVELWPAYLPHYRFVRFRQRASDGGGLVEMS